MRSCSVVWALGVLAALGCSGSPPERQDASTGSVPARVQPAATTNAQDSEPRCPDPAIVLEAGVERGLVCPADAASRKLTILDLRDEWTPRLFAIGSDGRAPSYRARYLALASERDGRGEPIEGEDALGELYGVLPSLAVARARLADDPRHRCHDFIDGGALPRLDRPYGQDHKELVDRANRIRAALEARLERERARLALPDLDALAGVRSLAAVHARWKKLAELRAGIVAAQKHFVCEDFLTEAEVDGRLTWRTGDAAELYQRRNFLMPNERLDAETRAALVLDSREHDFRLALRILRERVADAAGLIEDGTASTGPQPILGRMLDPANMRGARGREQPLREGAPDLVGQATEAAARQLGWLGPAETRAFLARYPGGVRVALALPAPPAYHAPHMQLFAEIDRGDVWYDAVPIRRRVARRPSLILYVDDHGTRRPLIRWPTTIGGWAEQRTERGAVVQRWKESEVGPRVWRDLFAAPTWLPPRSTPDRDLVKNLYNGHYALKREVFGPGPHAAYGMTLLVHHQAVKLRGGKLRLDNHGIGTHGSASVTSIVNGTSHGCHRMYNQLAVRLADFLLHHREHVVRGEQPVYYQRAVAYRADRHVAKVTTRGFLYELTPPVPVDVLRGAIRSARKLPPRNSAPARPD